MEVFHIITGAFLVLSVLNLVGLGFLVMYIIRLSDDFKKSTAALADDIKKSNSALSDEIKQASTNAPLVDFLVKLADEIKKSQRTLKTIEAIMEDINEEEEEEAQMKAVQVARTRQQRRAKNLPEEPGLVDVDGGSVSYDERYRPDRE